MVSSHTGKRRLRASKACQRCSRRKVKCDATEVGAPCSRCRMDSISECILITSRKGTYDRRNLKQRETRRNPHASSSTSSLLSLEETQFHGNPGNPPSPTVTSNLRQAEGRPAVAISEQGDIPNPGIQLPEISNLTHDTIRAQESNEAGLSHSRASSITTTTPGPRSLSSMFEDFLGQQGERRLRKAELVFFGEPSPLTFALQLRQDKSPSLHDTGQHVLSSASLAVIQDDIHPEHLAPHDIEYLMAKGAFIYPAKESLDDMLAVFMDRFYPIYSIVDPTELHKVHEERKLPWILLHSICFVAVTFCDAAMIYKAGFNSRAQARQLYYDRAKALFDLNYENNKMVLVKVAILLSFRGPQMDSFWNPCSWIEFGVTMAVGLGMHRNAAAVNIPPNDRGLLKRLWWALVVRDSHCSSMLGRPFRINITQSDVDMLKLDDFVDVHPNSTSATHQSCDCHEAFEYQIQVVKLSLILRDIMHFRFGPVGDVSSIDRIQEQLAIWKAQVPTAVQWLRGQSTMSVRAVQLEIMFNYHIMLLYIDQPGRSGLNPPSPTLPSRGYLHSAAIAESSALAVSSSAMKLVTHTATCAIPHEVFPGFFLAGITLFRQAQQTRDLNLAKMIRASFDNCQMLLNEAQSFWDPGAWAMKIFGFLLSAADTTDAADNQVPYDSSHDLRSDMPQMDVHRSFSGQTSAPSFSPVMNPMWSETPSFPRIEHDRNSVMDLGDYMLLPNFFTAPFGN